MWGFNGLMTNNSSQSAFSYGSTTTPGLTVRAGQGVPALTASTDIFIDATTGSTNLAFRGRLGSVVHQLIVTPDSGGLDAAGNSWLEYSITPVLPAGQFSRRSIPSRPVLDV